VAGGYLLRAQELIDLISDDDTQVKRWLAHRPDAAISVTVIGVAMARARLQDVDNAVERDEWERRFEDFVALTQTRSGPALGFDEIAARIWRLLLSAKTLVQVPRTALQEYAIASIHGLTVLERRRTWHADVAALGVPLEELP
jgi:hypothetical protein